MATTVFSKHVENHTKPPSATNFCFLILQSILNFRFILYINTAGSYNKFKNWEG